MAYFYIIYFLPALLNIYLYFSNPSYSHNLLISGFWSIFLVSQYSSGIIFKFQSLSTLTLLGILHLDAVDPTSICEICFSFFASGTALSLCFSFYLANNSLNF